jgi:hypothetical protein
MRNRKLLFFLIVCTALSLFGRDAGVIEKTYSARQFVASDGLPQMQITTMYTDSKGFVWVGTRYTFAKWDGKELKSFNSKLKESYEYVLGFEEFPNSNVLAYFRPLNNDIIKFVIISGNRLKHFKLKGALFNNIEQLKVSPVDNNRIQIVFLKNGNLYSYIYSRLNNKFEKGSLVPDVKWILKVEKGAVFYTNVPKISIDLKQVNVLVNHKTKSIPIKKTRLTKTQVFSNREKEFSASFVDYPNNLFLNIQSKGLDTLILYHHKVPFKLESNKICVSNLSGILYEYLPKKMIYYDFEKEYKLFDLPMPYCLEKDKSNNLYVGTELGLLNFFKMGIREIKLRLNEDFDNIWSMTKDRKGTFYYSSFTNGIYQSKDNKHYTKIEVPNAGHVGGFGANCNKYNDVLLPLSVQGKIPFVVNGRLQVFDFQKGNEIYTSAIDPATQDIYFSNIKSIYKFNATTKKVEKFKTAFDTLKRSNIISIVFTKDRKIAMKTSSDSYLLDLEGGYKELTALNRLGLAIVCDQYNGVWENYSISLFCTRNGKSIQLKNLKITTSILSMIEYGKWLVIGTYRDIVFFDLEHWYKTGEEKYIAYSIENDLNTLEGNQNNFFIDAEDSSIYWPCLDKVLQFNPKILTKIDSFPPKVSIEEYVFYSGNKKFATFDSLGQKEYRLGNNVRNFDVNFSNPLYVKNSFLKYRYRISPNHPWVELQLSQTIRLINLSAGVYVVEIQSSYDGKAWSQSEKSIPIILQSKYYETAFFWFFFLVVISAIGSMIIIFFLEIQKRKHQIEVQKQVEKNNLQLQVIKSKYVPHFTFNAITSINYLLRKKEIRKASSYLVKMTELQRIALTNFEKPEIPLETELRFLDSYLSLERLRFEELLEYKIILDKKVSMDTLISNLCIHTMVENAIKHGLYNKAEQKWRLRIYILKVKNKLILSVEDNGIGLEKAIENQFNSTGTGLIMLKKQIQILNSDERKYYFSLNTLYTPDGRIRGARSSIIIETLGQNQV